MAKKVQLHSGEWDLNAPVPWLEKLSHGTMDFQSLATVKKK